MLQKSLYKFYKETAVRAFAVINPTDTVIPHITLVDIPETHFRIIQRFNADSLFLPLLAKINSNNLNRETIKAITDRHMEVKIISLEDLFKDYSVLLDDMFINTLIDEYLTSLWGWIENKEMTKHIVIQMLLDAAQDITYPPLVEPTTSETIFVNKLNGDIIYADNKSKAMRTFGLSNSQRKHVNIITPNHKHYSKYVMTEHSLRNKDK